MAKHHSNPPPRPPKPPKSNSVRMSEPPMPDPPKETETETALPPLQPRQVHQIPPPLPPVSVTQHLGTFAVFSGHQHTHSPPSVQQPNHNDQTNNNNNNINNINNNNSNNNSSNINNTSNNNNNISSNNNNINNNINRFQTATPTTTTLPITVPLTSSSFSRRRPPPPGSALPIISSLTSSTLLNQSNNSQQLDSTTQISPVTLAAPRPETERLANEYVDTPFRTPKSVSRIQHAAIHSTHRDATAITAAHQSMSGHRNGNRTGIISGDKSNTITSITSAASDVKTHPSIVGRIQSVASATTDSLNLNRARTSIIDLAFFSHELRDRHGDKGIRCTDIPNAAAAAASAAAMRANSNRCDRSNVLPIPAITKQPLPFSKDSTTTGLHDDIDIHPANGETLNSITCPQCKRCRCEECQRPRQLPSRWVCDNTCLCSAETIIDYTSCLCCVKALFYHCSKDHEIECEGDSISCADDPCSCLPHKRTQRWAWLSALSLALPCLWFYWPMRGCVAICAKCYARHSRHGCRCPAQNSNKSTINNISSNNSGTNSTRTINRTGDLTPEKRLLDTSPEF